MSFEPSTTSNFFKNLFFRRMENVRKDVRNGYIHDLPKEVRHQLIHIILENMDIPSECNEFARKFAKEIGRLSLYRELANTNCEKIALFIKKESTEMVISLIEYFLYFKYVKYYKKLDELINEINKMFKVNKISYEIIPTALDGDLPYIVNPIYPKFLHAETIKEALSLLHSCEFKGALREFEEALDFLKSGKYDQAIVEALKSFESTVKAIIIQLEIEYDEKEDRGVRKLLYKLFDSGKFVDPSLKDSLDKVVSILQSGLPTLRNKPGVAHGSGLELRNLEMSYAKLAINLAGTYITFLIDRYNEI